MKDNNMNVVILAGGKGTRMRELTDLLPKPMVTIGGKPVLEHLIDYFESFRSFNFVICTGYKEEIIEDYFSNKKKFPNVNILQTGIETNTGGRILECKKIINGKFIMTYGDGLSDVDAESCCNWPDRGRFRVAWACGNQWVTVPFWQRLLSTVSHASRGLPPIW